MRDSRFSTLIDDLISLVIDVTYHCNSECLYCQWSSNTANSPEQMDILIHESTIKALKTERIVLSGGEPLLRKDLEDIISFYSNLKVKSIVLITNGLLLTEQRLKSLENAGLTGVTFSLDGMSEAIAFNARGLTKDQHNIVLNNLNSALEYEKSNPIELGINTVVSRENITSKDMSQLVEFCNNSKVDWIKFNPLFDDGFVGKNAPWLKLQQQDYNLIRKLGSEVVNNCKIKTNSIEFWESIASMLEGKKLLGSSCGLDKRQAMAIRGKIKFCYWIDNPIYGMTNSQLTPSHVRQIQSEFNFAKKNCNTGMHCYCLQRFDQKWELGD